METTKKIKRVNKDEPTGFDRFNRVSKGANAVLNIIFIIMSLLCVIPILLVVAISFLLRIPSQNTDIASSPRSSLLRATHSWLLRARCC